MATHTSKAGPGKSVTSHPLFPAVLALWFGALFGFGSLAIRASLLERLVLAAHIDLIIPAAAPPLGITARLLLALGLAAFGATLGAWIGRKLGMVRLPKRERQRDARRFEAKPVRRSARTSAAPALTDGVDEYLRRSAELPAIAGRRRMLALDEGDNRPDPHETAPLPGTGPQIFAVADTGIAPIGTIALESAAPEVPLELQEYAAPAPIEPAPAPVAAVALPEPVTAPAPSSVFETPTAVPLFAPRAAEAPPVPAVQREPIAPDLPLPELAQRLAEAMRRRRAASAPAEVAAPAALPMPTAMRPRSAEAVDGELVLPSLLPPRLDPLAPPVPSAPLAMPAAMRAATPEALAAIGADDEPLASLLPPRQLYVPPVAPAPTNADDYDDSDDETVADDTRFTSLLAIAPRTDFVRIEQPAVTDGDFQPVVIFPGHGLQQPVRPFDAPIALAAAPFGAVTSDPTETERALKSALANLQRMSGTA